MSPERFWLGLAAWSLLVLVLSFLVGYRCGRLDGKFWAMHAAEMEKNLERRDS
jgi:hypothetical protein